MEKGENGNLEDYFKLLPGRNFLVGVFLHFGFSLVLFYYCAMYVSFFLAHSQNS